MDFYVKELSFCEYISGYMYEYCGMFPYVYM